MVGDPRQNTNAHTCFEWRVRRVAESVCYAVLIKKDGARGLSLATRGPDVMVKVKVKGNNGGDWVEDSMKVVNMAGN